MNENSTGRGLELYGDIFDFWPNSTYSTNSTDNREADLALVKLLLLFFPAFTIFGNVLVVLSVYVSFISKWIIYIRGEFLFPLRTNYESANKCCHVTVSKLNKNQKTSFFFMLLMMNWWEFYIPLNNMHQSRVSFIASFIQTYLVDGIRVNVSCNKSTKLSLKTSYLFLFGVYSHKPTLFLLCPPSSSTTSH